MYIHEPIYDLDELFLENCHMHTKKYSRCAKPDAIIEDMVREAKRVGLKRIAFTDHVEADKPLDVQPMDEDERVVVAAMHPDIEVIFGSELSAYAVDKYTMMNCDYEPQYRLYSTNHYHLKWWEHPSEQTPRGYKEHNKKILENIISTGRCDCIAHPFIEGYIHKRFDWEPSGEAHLVQNEWSENELGELLLLSNKNKTAWELHPSLVIGSPKFARKFFNLAKETGAVFNMGTDAHTLKIIDTFQYLDDYKRILL